ncbi:TetR/AcrR family transcriptional regulator [Amorphoplanes nipponensis]|uniref:TetR family transcriptional regulator n=1 Tax=Actinoplanes nipponensis TaxID=135950 RepID=A0A919MRT9_9ACTN|nr:TetR/AcrR family transcriptional regulator [Actinoplanes nipponensis]GIE47300.1 TetR family transcriptional regulator [Actinoplanes nipponensis]
MVTVTGRRPEVSLRERKRAATISEIKAVALRQLADEGGAMTLRGVSREMGMTVQSLYHYFPSRDELITALIVDGYEGLAGAVEKADAEGPAEPAGERLLRLARAYRQWAIDHRAEFLLIFGTPVPGYRAPDPGPTIGAARRLGAAFAGAVFAGWSAEQIARLELPRPDPLLARTLQAGAEQVAPHLPAPAYGIFIELWGRMHGLVMLEILHHLPWLTPLDAATSYYESATLHLVSDLEHRRTGCTPARARR